MSNYPNISSWNHNIYKSDILPPLNVPKRVKDTDAWKKAILDSFEHIGITQFAENMEFYDYYRMIDGELSFQELAEVIPQLDNLQDLLDGVGIPTFLKHYDIMGLIINAIVGKYVDMQNKFHVTDTGEVAENEFLRFKNDELTKALVDIINNHVQIKLAERGLDPNGQQFQSEEEQQAFMQQLEEEKKRLTPKDLDRATKQTFKSTGMKWGEATMERDREIFNLTGKFEKAELKDKLASGRYFRHYRLKFDSYEPERWDPRNTFFSKEMSAEFPQKGEYVGRVHFQTPAEVINNYPHKIDSKTQKELMGGNISWRNFVGEGVVSGTINQAIESNFVKTQRVPFSNFYDYNLALGFQDTLGIPMGDYTSLEPGSDGRTTDRMLPRMMNDTYGRYNYYASVLRNDFIHREDLCQITEVYFRAYDLYGYLTYENEFGRKVTELVSEDILKDFIKDNEIKQTFKESLEEIITEFESGTIKWFYKPVVYEAVKIQSGNLQKPIYLYCQPTDHQLKGDSEFDVRLPVGGYIGKSLAKKMMPFQASYNLCMNQIFSMLEKEIGMFFLMDINLIPSEYEGWGDASDALVALRNTAKDIGIMPVATSGDAQKDKNNFQGFTTHNISYTGEISNRIQLADIYQKKAYETVGINPQTLVEPTKYQTAEGVRQNVEATFAQLSDIYEDFFEANRNVLELHLGVAQYAQSNKKDISLYYTKSDASIEFLKLSDPDFPLRRVGLVMSSDSKKKKVLAEFKSYLLQTNTLGSDTLEIARLIGSDAFSEVIEIATIERENREIAEQAKYEQESQLIEQKAQMEDQKEQAKWERNEVSKERDRQARKEIELIDATGRASGKDASPESFAQLDKVADRALKEKSLNVKADTDLKSMKLKEKAQDEGFKIRMEELKLKAKEIEARIKGQKTQEYVATVNKN